MHRLFSMVCEKPSFVEPLLRVSKFIPAGALACCSSPARHIRHFWYVDYYQHSRTTSLPRPREKLLGFHGRLFVNLGRSARSRPEEISRDSNP